MGCGLLALRARSALGGAIVAAGLCLAATMFVPALLGFDRYVITGDSMSPTIDRGSLVYSEEVPVSELGVGDVITYTPPRGAGPEGMVTHRIVSIHRGRDGEPVFRTKGDGNRSRDPWSFRLDQPTQTRVKFSIPYIGYVFAALGVREVRMAVIGLPALAVATVLMAGLWRQAGEEAAARRREAGL